MGGAPIVLEVGIRRNRVPIAGSFISILSVVLRIAENEVRVIKAGSRSVETKTTLSFGKVVLHLLVNGPAATDLELVRTSGPREVVPNLIIIGSIVPWQPVDRVVRSRRLRQVDVRNPVIYVGAGENPVEGKPGRRAEDTLGQNVNAVPVVVERNFV